MPQTGEIDLNSVKALYTIEDIVLVDKNLIEQANEYRLFFEVVFAIGLTILGSVLGKWDQSQTRDHIIPDQAPQLSGGTNQIRHLWSICGHKRY